MTIDPAGPGARAGTAGARPSLSVGARCRAWAALGKVDSIGIYGVPLLIGFSQLPSTVWRSPRLVAFGLLALLGAAAVFIAAVALDDVCGYRDGTDAANYGREGDQRQQSRKPLLSGRMTERQAVAFAVVSWTNGALLWCAALALAPARPLAALVLVAGLVVLAPQYSWGLRLSYRGLGEALMMYFSIALVIAVPLLAGRPCGPGLLCQALLVGLWHVTVSSYANLADVEGDRAIRRHTVATWLGPRGNRAYLGLLTVADPVVVTVTVWVSGLLWWPALPLLPVLLLRARRARDFLRTGDAHAANANYWRLYRLGGLALTAANLASHPLPPL